MIEIDFDRLRTLGLTPALANFAFVEASACKADHPEALPLDLLRVTGVHRETVCLHDGADEL
ncbi:hypothetical protein WB334_24830, partial [Escherichia coli]|uniref:hypothetical protein n=1 Tax=Escherichia coli TaxID=562 RepID=UPI00215747F5